MYAAGAAQLLYRLGTQDSSATDDMQVAGCHVSTSQCLFSTMQPLSSLVWGRRQASGLDAEAKALTLGEPLSASSGAIAVGERFLFGMLGAMPWQAPLAGARSKDALQLLSAGKGCWLPGRSGGCKTAEEGSQGANEACLMHS